MTLLSAYFPPKHLLAIQRVAMKAAFAYPSTKITLTSLFVTCCLFYLFNLHLHKHSPNPHSHTLRSSSFDAAALVSFADNATRIHDNIGDVRNETLGVGLLGI